MKVPVVLATARLVANFRTDSAELIPPSAKRNLFNSTEHFADKNKTHSIGKNLIKAALCSSFNSGQDLLSEFFATDCPSTLKWPTKLSRQSCCEAGPGKCPVKFAMFGWPFQSLGGILFRRALSEIQFSELSITLATFQGIYSTPRYSNRWKEACQKIM